MAESSTQAQKSAEAPPKAGPSKKNRSKGKAASTAAAGPSVLSPPPPTKPAAAASGPPTGPKATNTAAAAPGGSKKARQRRKKAANPQANLKLKVVVRRLPPNLPEAIFWKSVEPWTGPQELASSTSQAVAGPVSSAGQKQQAEPSGQPPEAAVPEVRAPEGAEGGPAQKAAGTNVAAETITPAGEPSTASVGPSDVVEKPATSSPPPKKPGPYLDLGQPGQGKLSWRRYVTGKLKVPNASSISTSSGSPPLHTHSRAYLRFKTLNDLIDFHKNFDGHVFRDAKGNESIALVEWAPFQKVAPPVLDVKKRDRKEGTIEEDGDYLDFVQKLNAKASSGEDKNEGGKTTTTEGDLLAHLSGLQAAKNDSTAIEARKHTPLLDHLRQQKANKKTAKQRDAKTSKRGGKLRNPWNALANESSTEGSSTAGGSSSTPTGPGSIKNRKKAAAREAATGSPLKKEKGTPKRSLGTTADTGRDSPIPTSTTNDTPAAKANKGKEKAKKKPNSIPATAGEASSATGDDGVIAAGNTPMQGVPKGPKPKKKKAPPSQGPTKADGSVTIEKGNDIAPAAILQRPTAAEGSPIRVTPPPPTVAAQQPSIPTGPRAASGGGRGGRGGGRGRGGGSSGARGGRGAAAAGGNGTAGPAGP